MNPTDPNVTKVLMMLAQHEDQHLAEYLERLNRGQCPPDPIGMAIACGAFFYAVIERLDLGQSSMKLSSTEQRRFAQLIDEMALKLGGQCFGVASTIFKGIL